MSRGLSSFGPGRRASRGVKTRRQADKEEKNPESRRSKRRENKTARQTGRGKKNGELKAPPGREGSPDTGVSHQGRANNDRQEV